MSRVSLNSYFRLLLAIPFLIPLLIQTYTPATAQGTCGETYTVLPGDTIGEIAELCETTVVAILEINPEITDPTQIVVGQVIRIPQGVSAPVLAITPACGPAESLLSVMGSGFPSNSTVEISMGPINQSKFIVELITSDDLGRVATEVFIPLNAVSYSSWVVIAEADSGNIHFEATSNRFYVLGPIPNPPGATTYTVQTGDTLSSIASKFNRNLEALYSANPQIAESGQLTVGQSLLIPAMDPEGPQLKLSPICGPPDSPATLTGSQFPAESMVNIQVGEYLGVYEPVGSVEVDGSRSFSTDVLIPPGAVAGENWTALANTEQTPSARAIANIYAVTSTPDPGEPAIYTIQPLDTLNQIAIEFRRTVNSILAANPQITNPNTLTVGSPIIIPGLQETVLLIPTSGTPGTRIRVTGGGFPPQSKVEVYFGRRGTRYELVETAITNSIGLFESLIAVPTTAVAGERWVVLATQSVVGEPRNFALSNEFAVSNPEPPAAAFVSIWPTSGPPETELTIVASGFHGRTQVSFSIGQSGSEGSSIITTWTEINGTAAGDTHIPASASPGENWSVTVREIEDPAVEASSELFAVTDEGAPFYDSINIFLIELGGGEIGCGDAVHAVVQEIPQTSAPLYAALDSLLSNDQRIDSDSGLYNSLYLSDLTIESIEETGETITLKLVGDYRVQETCDHPRALAQIEQTALRYSTANTFELIINGEPFESLIPQG